MSTRSWSARAVVALMAGAAVVAGPAAQQAAAAGASITVSTTAISDEFCTDVPFTYDAAPPDGYPHVSVYITASDAAMSDHASSFLTGASGSGALAFCGIPTPGTHHADMSVKACTSDDSSCESYDAPRAYFELTPKPPGPPPVAAPAKLKVVVKTVTRSSREVDLHIRTYLDLRDDRTPVTAKLELQVATNPTNHWVTIARAASSGRGHFTWRIRRPGGQVLLRVEAKAHQQIKDSRRISIY